MSSEMRHCSWSTPKVARFGTFRELTQQYCDKTLGNGDGFTFMGQPITCRSS